VTGKPHGVFSSSVKLKTLEIVGKRTGRYPPEIQKDMENPTICKSLSKETIDFSTSFSMFEESPVVTVGFNSMVIHDDWMMQGVVKP